MDYADHDGVRLAYVEAGEGDPPILLVHGMRCDHTHMAPLFDHLSSTHRVVSLDMRGHGESDKPVGDYSNEVLADDLRWLCSHLELERPVAIGHSFGGSVSLHLAVTHPEVLSGLVLLDSGVRTTAEKDAEMGAVIGVRPASASERPKDFLGDRLFGRDDAPAQKDAILATMGSSVPEHASREMGKTVLSFDSGAAAIECTLPSLLVLSDRPFTTAAMLDRLGSNWRVGRVVGAGHFVQVFAAAQVNAMVDRFLELLAVAHGAHSPVIGQ